MIDGLIEVQVSREVAEIAHLRHLARVKTAAHVLADCPTRALRETNDVEAPTVTVVSAMQDRC